MADVQQKGIDEIFCSSCGAIIKKAAEICPKCGVRQKEASIGMSKKIALAMAIGLGIFAAFLMIAGFSSKEKGGQEIGSYGFLLMVIAGIAVYFFKSKESVIKKIIIIISLIATFGIIGWIIGVYNYYLKKYSHDEHHPAVVAAKARQDSIAQQTSMGATLAAPIEVNVKISGEDGRHLKCGVQLEYDLNDEQLGTELETRKARIKDIVIDIMSSQALSDLMSNDGKKAIRDQIVAAVNNILPEKVAGKPLGKVRRSYFDSFYIE